LNSEERVKAAIHFKNPDKIPEFNVLKGDITLEQRGEGMELIFIQNSRF
jgi:hypothetical protein